jgi:acyl-CoA synthetase (AMP-forming)/AMP-acid ligase II
LVALEKVGEGVLMLMMLTCFDGQGYGLTETMAGSCISLPKSKGANVGPPMPGVQIRLESVPDMNYDALANPPRGEILIGGATVFSGYFKRDDLTKDVLGNHTIHCVYFLGLLLRLLCSIFADGPIVRACCRV